MIMATMPSMQQTRVFALGLALWILGTGSVLHPMLLEVRDSHYCSYGLTGWPTAMWISASVGLLVFPIMLTIARAVSLRGLNISFAEIALRVGATHVGLIVVGIVLAIFVSTGSVGGTDPIELSPLMLTPVLFGVLIIRPSDQGGLFRSLISFLPRGVVLSVLPVFLLLWRLNLLNGVVADGSIWPYFVWSVPIALGLVIGLVTAVTNFQNKITLQVSLAGTAMLLATTPTVLVLVGSLVAHELFCLD